MVSRLKQWAKIAALDMHRSGGKYRRRIIWHPCAKNPAIGIPHVTEFAQPRLEPDVVILLDMVGVYFRDDA